MTDKSPQNQPYNNKRPDPISAIAPPRPGADPATMGFDGYGKDATDCGDTIEFYVNLHNRKVQEITCKVSGCNNTLISARAAGLLVKGKPLKEAFKLVSGDNVNALARLPEPNRHCADLAATALMRALRSAALSSREPWRKLYRRH